MAGELKPGWADALGRAASKTELEPSEWKTLRAIGKKPFRRSTKQDVDSRTRGTSKSAAAHRRASRLPPTEG